jgi:membrane-bound inhibitor of C-type lysozyme
MMLLGAAALFAGQAPALAQIFSTYHCGDGSEFVVAFYEGDKRAHVQLDGKAMALQKRISLSGARYTRGDITLRMTKTATTLKRGRRLTDCSAN